MTAPQGTPANLSMHVTFVMDSHACYLPIVRATVSQLAAMVGWNESDSRAITLAIDEALANVIRHAYHGRPDGRVELECHAGLDELQFRIQDNGDPPNPALICAREVGCDQIGGLGTHIIRDVMDVVSYESSPEGNRFTAAKRLRRQANDHLSS
jgi:anti-sigma regulatory factor (Ser/Thr protein kinase)